jgi:hypothetical protein
MSPRISGIRERTNEPHAVYQSPKVKRRSILKRLFVTEWGLTDLSFWLIVLLSVVGLVCGLIALGRHMTADLDTVKSTAAGYARHFPGMTEVSCSRPGLGHSATTCNIFFSDKPPVTVTCDEESCINGAPASEHTNTVVVPMPIYT